MIPPMPSEREPEPKSDQREPPRGPPVALGLFDEDDYIRHLGDRIVALAPRDASALLLYLNADVALTVDGGLGAYHFGGLAGLAVA
jgi:hypothetical protein